MQEATEEINAGRGRIEMRQLRTRSDIQWLQAHHPDGKGPQSIVEVTTQRELKEKSTTETRYFISSADDRNPARLGQAVQGH